jgi:hypothetical protein
MERSVLLNMRRALLLFMLSCLAIHGGATSHTLVLVVRADSKVSDLNSLTVRKLFLGLPVLIDGHPLHPIRNRSDQQLDPIFLQQIVAMSESSYERQILIGVNRQGRLRPAEVDSTSAVLDALYADPNAVSFMWLRDVAHDPRIRVVRVLWAD